MANRARVKWVRKLEFLFTELGYMIGLGNIWRFPYRCYIYGGGTFLIPYFLTVILCAIPVLFLEIFLGQFSSTGAITIWNICPLFKGIGWAILFNIFMICIYYSVIVMYSFYYMLVAFVSIGGDLPWLKCDQPWNTEDCRDKAFSDSDTKKYPSPEEEFWNRYVLGEHESDGFANLGPVHERNAICLLMIWILTFYCCLRGIRSIAKVTL